MAKESPFVEIAHAVAIASLPASNFAVQRGAALLYQITVDNQLQPLDVELIRNPVRGNSAFQTDLCVFEKKNENVSIPRVVMEFKTSITTHDVLTYSAKATKHKQVYPYLRYGIIASAEATVPGRLFTHNESLDFCAAVDGLDDSQLKAFFEKLLAQEVETSRQLEKIAFSNVKTRLFRTEIEIKQ